MVFFAWGVAALLAVLCGFLALALADETKRANSVFAQLQALREAHHSEQAKSAVLRRCLEARDHQSGC